MDEICQDDQWFEQAFTYMNQHDIPLSNDKKLHFYGLFKQATVGDCNIDKPGLFEFVARAKYDSWKGFAGLSFREARNAYIEGVEALKVGWSRQGEYEYIPSAEEIKNSEGMSGNSVSQMADSEQEEDEDEEGGEHFQYAIDNDAHDLRRLLHNENIDINETDSQGFTMLHYAADRGNYDVVDLLIDMGADVDATTPDGETPLHLACISEQSDVSQLLLRNECDISIKDAEGKTALEQASEAFRQEVL